MQKFASWPIYVTATSNLCENNLSCLIAFFHATSAIEIAVNGEFNQNTFAKYLKQSEFSSLSSSRNTLRKCNRESANVYLNIILFWIISKMKFTVEIVLQDWNNYFWEQLLISNYQDHDSLKNHTNRESSYWLNQQISTLSS